MGNMTRRGLVIGLGVALAAGCADTDVENTGGEIAPGQELEDSGVELDVEPVDLAETPWFAEGRSVRFNDRNWVVVGEPIFDPAVEHVGDFEATPLYAEVNGTPPYAALYIPLEDDYWQRLGPGPPGNGAAAPEEWPEGAEGVSPTGDPTGATDTSG